MEQDFRSPFQELEEKQGEDNIGNGEPSQSLDSNTEENEKQRSEEWEPAFPDEDSGKYAKKNSHSDQVLSVESHSNNISIDIDDLELDGDLLGSGYSELDENQEFQETLETLWKKVKGKGQIMATQPEEGTYLDKLDKQRKQERKLVSLSFVKRGYGVNHLKAEFKHGAYLHSSLDESRYKSLAGSVVREAFRRLESFLLRDCRIKVESLSGYEMKLLQTLLLNCRNTLPAHCVPTFLKIITITNCLEQSSVNQKECIDLYNSIYSALRKKVMELRGQEYQRDSLEDEPERRISKNGLCGRIDSNYIKLEVQQQIIRQFIQQQSFSRVRDKVRRKFRISENKLNVKVIRNVLRRVLRATIRTIQSIMNERVRRDRGSELKYTDENIKHVLQVGSGAALRGKLCKLHLVDCQDNKLMMEVYREIESLLHARGWYFRR